MLNHNHKVDTFSLLIRQLNNKIGAFIVIIFASLPVEFIQVFMNISLSPEFERLIEKKLKSGMYNSASEVVRAGLRLLQEQEELRGIRLSELKHEIQLGLNEIEEGKIVDGEQVFKELRRRNQKLLNKKTRK